MTKAELIAAINAIPLELLDGAVKDIINSNPNNAITMNRAYHCTYCLEVYGVKFLTRATKENIINVYHAILDEIAVHHGIETMLEIAPGYRPAWYTPEEPAPAEEPAARPARVSISPGNNKMGAIPSVSLPPVITCPRGVPCAAKCYAAKLCRLRPTVREAYARNLEILLTDPLEYWRQVRFAASVARYFRFHVSGDIPGADYLAEMIATAEALPGTDFLAFTKNYAVVNAWFDNGGQLPGNLHLIFSEWGRAEIPNPHNFPTAAVIFKGEEPREGWKVCGGNCTECACRGVGCWELKSGETIAFYEH